MIHTPAPAPAIDIEKATNGDDADTPTGPQVVAGSRVHWTYVVVNTGNVELTDVTVVDDQGVTITCPSTTLAVGASMTCTASGISVEGQYANFGKVTGTYNGTTVTDTDLSHYFGAPAPNPAIDLEKYINGEDADTPTGPQVTAGSHIVWT